MENKEESYFAKKINIPTDFGDLDSCEIYPLTAAQKLHSFLMRAIPKRQLLNTGTSLVVDHELDFDAFQTAIYKAYERCESMCIRYTIDKKGNVFQYLVDHTEQEIEFFDFRGWSEADTKAKLEEWTRIPFNPYNSQMNRTVMIILPNGWQGLYLLVEHSIMDGQSLILLYNDILDIYCNIKYNTKEYPKSMSPYVAQLKKDLKYYGSKNQECDRKFFTELIGNSEPIYAGLDGPGLLERQRIERKKPLLRAADYNTGSFDAEFISFQLEAAPTEQLMKFCTEQQFTPLQLLVMGLRTYLQKENNLDDISIITTNARRATLSEKRCGGSRIHLLPLRTIVPREKTFLEALTIIRDKLNAIYRHANFDPMEYFLLREQMYLPEGGGTYEPLSLTYQPMFIKNEMLDNLGIQYRTALYNRGIASHVAYLYVSHDVYNNTLDFNWEYRPDNIKSEKLEYVHYNVCKILFTGIKNPEITVNNLITSV